MCDRDISAAFGIKTLYCVARLSTVANTMAVRYKRGPRPAGWAWRKIKFQHTKKYIYRFSATYDVSFSLRNCATPQKGIFMVHKFSSELMFSQTPDPPRSIVPTATKRLKIESRYVIHFSAPPVLSPATLMLYLLTYLLTYSMEQSPS